MLVKDLNFQVYDHFSGNSCDLAGNREEGGSSAFVIFIYIVLCYTYTMYLLYVLPKDDQS